MIINGSSSKYASTILVAFIVILEFIYLLIKKQFPIRSLPCYANSGLTHLGSMALAHIIFCMVDFILLCFVHWGP